MALALLVFSDPNDETGSARVLLRQVETDHKALVRFEGAFNSDSSPNATEFEHVKGQLAALQGHLRDLSMRYHRYPRQIYKRVLQDNALRGLRQNLERQKRALGEEYDACSIQLLIERDSSDQIRIKRRIEALEDQIKAIEGDLEKLDQS